jgi:phospholipid/cholesterol/gamma-HCH transport system ATP-binding protein
MSSNKVAVEFRQVSKSFGGRQVLNDVSFQVLEGETICILGRSGTGKSVTLKLMIGLLKPDEGNVFIGSEDICGMDERELSRIRREIGFLFQSAALFDSFTVGQNLSLPMQRFEPDKSAGDVKKTVGEMLQQVGLAQDIGKLPRELSGGMKKRAGLARALVLNPKLLLIDEPSSGLDRVTASEIDTLLLKVKSERHTTMVIVTHDIHGARKLADKVAVLDQGFLVGFGTFDELGSSQNEVVRALTTEC